MRSGLRREASSKKLRSSESPSRGWEAEQGQENGVLVCPVCECSWLSPTARGTSRPYRRWGERQSSRERVRQLRRDIQTLQGELDQELEMLQEEANPEPVV